LGATLGRSTHDDHQYMIRRSIQRRTTSFFELGLQFSRG
jgi:hypothetical protein